METVPTAGVAEPAPNNSPLGSGSSQDVAPMLERNVKYHVLLTQLEKPPKVALDDCCVFCEKYRDRAITPLRRKEIDTWRQDVNNISNNNNNKNSIRGYNNRSSSASSSATFQMKKASGSGSEFRYSPPGYPDTEPGFRRIRVNGDLRRDIEKLDLQRAHQQQRSKRNKNRVDFFKLTSDVASMSMDYHAERVAVTPSNADSLPDTWKQNWPNRNATQRAVHQGQYNGFNAEQSVKKTKKVKTKSAPSKLSTYVPNSTPRSDQNEYKTCSNDLLNVISIDDYSLRHKLSGAARISRESGISNVEEDPFLSRSKGQVLRSPGSPTSSVSTMSFRPGTDQRNTSSFHYDTHRRLSPSESGYNSEHGNVRYYGDSVDANNEAVGKAFNSIITGTDTGPTNSHAHKGLYKYGSNSKDPTNVPTAPKESRKFQKLNKALHEWIKTEITDPQQNARLRNRSFYSYAPTTPGSESKRSRSTWRSGAGQSDLDEQPNGAFLGMLMEMDENTDGRGKIATESIVS